MPESLRYEYELELLTVTACEKPSTSVEPHRRSDADAGRE
jgi:hypothetical protein